VIPVSVCIITCNEEDNLRACFESVKWADDIIVVDSHSTDNTRQIAAEYTDHVIERDWLGHIQQKNFAIQQAAHDWVFCIDADERVSDDMRMAIEGQMTRGDDFYHGFSFPRRNRYMGQWIRYCGWYPDRKIRLFRKSKAQWEGTNPHDHVQVDGPVKALSGDLMHESYKDLADHMRTINSFTSIAAQERFASGQRFVLPFLVFGPCWKFFKMYILKLGFLDGVPGFAVCVSGAYYVFLKYAKLLELGRAQKRDNAL